jgi:glycogen operon protein
VSCTTLSTGRATAHPHAAADSVLYEVHVRVSASGSTPCPKPLRGTYAGLASDWAIAHFKHLGVTALSLLPVHQHLDEERLVQLG